MIDIWMLFTMTLPFLEVVLYTTSEVFKQPRATHCSPDKWVDVIRVKSAREQEEEPKTSNSMSCTLIRLTGCLMPIGSLFFTVIFWVVGLIASYSSPAVQDPNMTDCLGNDGTSLQAR